MKVVMAMLAVLPMTLEAQELNFSPGPVEACIAENTEAMTEHTCIGTSANACMLTDDGGMTTVGMGYCLEQEWQYWDARLNAAYKVAMAEARQIDAEMAELDLSALKQAPALRDMQRAWITFRDAKCDHARSLWGGGTGGGPAALSCLMVTTGEQSLYLETMSFGG